MRTGKTLYFDCAMGAAGDTLLGALFALAPAQDAFLQAFAALELPGVALTVQPVTQGETRGVQMELTVGGVTESAAQLPGTAPQHQHGHHHHHHDHRSLPDVEAILAGLPVSAWVAEQARAVYGRIAAAEAAAHGVPVRQVHFHEVGALDAIGDVVGCCMLLEQLAPAYICASPVSTGRGTVRCAHGELPVPAPATAFLLQGIRRSLARRRSPGSCVRRPARRCWPSLPRPSGPGLPWRRLLAAAALARSDSPCPTVYGPGPGVRAALEEEDTKRPSLRSYEPRRLGPFVHQRLVVSGGSAILKTVSPARFAQATVYAVPPVREVR